MTHVFGFRADQNRVKLFGRDDQARSATNTNAGERVISEDRPKSRLNEECAKLREVHGELDSIEGRIAALREHQAAFMLRSSEMSKRPKPGRVETVDLRSLVDVDVSTEQLERAERARRSQLVTVERVAAAEAAWSDEARDTVADRDDDFDRRFAAFAATDNDEWSRRWLDTD